MFLAKTKTLLTDAMRTTFDSDYVEPDFRNLLVSIEYPMQQHEYPSILVDMEVTGELEVAGIGHVEYAEEGADEGTRGFTRWRMTGYAAYTVVALSSFERDRLFDEVVRVMAFGKEAAQTNEFRSYIEDNEFIALNFDFDQIGVRAIAAAAGTPWGTDEMVYEATIAMEFVGEFVSDHQTQTLIPLSAVVVTHYSDDEVDPTEGQPEDGSWI